MALSGIVVPTSVSMLLLMLLLTVQGSTPDLLEKVRSANESDPHVQEINVDDGKENLVLERTDNLTPVPSVSEPNSLIIPSAPSSLLPSPRVSDQHSAPSLPTTPNTLSGGNPLKPSSPSSLPPRVLVSDQHPTPSLPTPNTLSVNNPLKPSAPSSLSPSPRVSDQQSSPSLPTPNTPSVDNPLKPSGWGSLPPEDKDILSAQQHATATLANTISLNDDDSGDEESSDWFDTAILLCYNPELDPSFSPSTFLRSLCPAQFCGEQVDKKTPEDACCLPCYCTEHCNANRTCCSENGFFSNTSQSSSATPEVCTNPALRLRFDGRYTQSYMMVSTCSPLFTDLSYVTKCEDSDDLTMDSLTPIYHSETDLTYRNVFCAICNFATEPYTRWIPKLSCRHAFLSDDIFKSSKSFTDVIHNTKDEKACDVIWDPVDVSSKPCYKRQDLISTCESFYVIPAMRVLCEEDEFISPIIYMGIAYKNIYCLNCSGVPIHKDVCIKNDQMEDRNFEAILNIDVFNEGLTANEPLMESQRAPNGPCEAGFEMITDLMACGKTSCSTSKDYKNGVCQPVYDEVEGAGFQFSLSIVFQTIPQMTDKVKLVSQQFLPYNLVICSDNIEMNITTSTNNALSLYVEYWATMVSDSVVNIHEVYSEFEQRVNAHSNSEYTVEIGIGTGYAPLPIEFKNYIHYDIPGSHWACPSPIAMAKIQFCDTVLIDFKFVSFKGNMLVINGFQFKPDTYLIRTNSETSPYYVQICQDTLEQLGISLGNERDIGNNGTFSQTSDPQSSGVLGLHAGIRNMVVMYLFSNI